MFLALIAAVVLSVQTAPVDPDLGVEARDLVAPVSASLEAEKARQAALPPPVDDRERLDRMGALDQTGRQAYSRLDFSSLPPAQRQAARAAAWRVIAETDAELMEALLAMVPPEGWFLTSVYGEQAAGAAFLIVQHSGPEHWRRFIPVLEPLVATGEVDGQTFGMMYDRLALSEGRPQRYGTQMTCRDGRWVVSDLEAPEAVDERRRAMGFPGSLAEYEAHFATYPPCG